MAKRKADRTTKNRPSRRQDRRPRPSDGVPSPGPPSRTPPSQLQQCVDRAKARRENSLITYQTKPGVSSIMTRKVRSSSSASSQSSFARAVFARSFLSTRDNMPKGLRSGIAGRRQWAPALILGRAVALLFDRRTSMAATDLGLNGLEMKAHPHMLRHATGYALANRGTDTRTLQASLAELLAWPTDRGCARG